MPIFAPWITFIVSGTLITVQYAVISLSLGAILGTFLAVAQLSHRRAISLAAKTYVSVIRGTPLLLQLCTCYYVLPRLINVDLSPFSAGIIAFSLNSAAYVTEIIRAGIQAVDSGQFEAAHTLNIPKYLAYRDIIIPQAVHKILPALVNEMVNLLKETAIIGMIGELDIMRRSQLVAAETYDYFPALLVAAANYYFLVAIFTYGAKSLDKYLHDKYR